MNVYYDCKPNSVPQENDDKTLDITERTVSEDGGERVVFGKLYGRTLDKSTFKEGLLRYFVPFGTAGHNQHSAKLANETRVLQALDVLPGPQTRTDYRHFAAQEL